VLVVEDEQALRELTGEFLRNLGYTVLAADSGQQALSVASLCDRSIDVLVTDVVMPKMSGRQLSQMLSEIRPGLKTIYMSGYTDDAVMRHGIREAAVVFLQKPFSLATLARKLREVIGTDQPK
jgi:CheY-like chemotaxis protein